jgi:hypothetical protein
MSKHDAWFIEERAFAFASLVLTKRNDVAVRAEAGRDMAVDLLIEVLKDGKPSLRFFGVQIVADIDLPDFEDADERVLSHLGSEATEATLPLCVFVIGVRKPEGIYRWIVEPVVDDGRALLRRDVDTTWQPLDESEAARLIGQVNAWYDTLNGGSTPKARARHSKTES